MTDSQRPAQQFTQNRQHETSAQQRGPENHPARTTPAHSRIAQQLASLAQAKRFAEGLGDDQLDLFAQSLEQHIRPITVIVHNAVANALGFPTLPFDPPASYTREKVAITAPPAADQTALKKRLLSLERSNHDLRSECNSVTNQVTMSRVALQRTESQYQSLIAERDDLKALASELEQSRKSLKAELLEVKEKRDLLAVELRQKQTHSAPPTASENLTPDLESTPRPSGGQSSSSRIAPPALTVTERHEIERMSATLMATLVRLAGFKIRTADIGSVTGITTGWKRTVEHLISLGQVAYLDEFLCISDVEKIRRNLK